MDKVFYIGLVAWFVVVALWNWRILIIDGVTPVVTEHLGVSKEDSKAIIDGVTPVVTEHVVIKYVTPEVIRVSETVIIDERDERGEKYLEYIRKKTVEAVCNNDHVKNCIEIKDISIPHRDPPWQKTIRLTLTVLKTNK